MTTTDALDTTTVVHLPIASLTEHPDSLRLDTGSLTGLAKSIREGGVIEPLIVAPTDDATHRVVAGHRRLAAAAEAGHQSVPCIVREDLDAAGHVVVALVENIHRRDLTAAEEVRGIAQLALLGVSDTKAARATGLSRAHVRKARAVADDTVAFESLVTAPALSFDQALVVAELAGDDQAEAARLAELAVTAPGRFEHHASAIRRDRADARRRAERTAELAAQGVTVLTDDDLRAPAAGLSSLTAADTPAGEFVALDPDTHAACPGHAVSLDPWDADRLRYWCTDPTANGHRTRWPERAAAIDDEVERERKREERRTVIANNKAWRAAEPVRREYVAKLLAAKRVPKATMRYIVTALMAAPESFGRTGDDALLAELTGTKPSAQGYGRHVGTDLAERAADARLPLVLLAQHAADMEGTMGTHTWRHADPRAARYLAYLATTGYTLSDIEATLVETLDPPNSDEAADTDRPGVGPGPGKVIDLPATRGHDEPSVTGVAADGHDPAA
jgi:ParB family chromosome partitioning protein